MEEKLIFVSVGATATAEQESFVRLIEDRLRSESLTPKTVGRNTFSADAPLKAITELMEHCSGIVVIALERSYFPAGLDKRGGSRQANLSDTRLPTPWNHIEAAMAYTKHLPLLVIIEAGLKAEGLLEPGYDWYVQTLPLEAMALSSNEFNGVLADWKDKVLAMGSSAKPRLQGLNPAEMSVLDLVGALRPVQLWSVAIALAGLLAGAFSLGARLVPPSKERTPPGQGALLPASGWSNAGSRLNISAKGFLLIHQTAIAFDPVGIRAAFVDTAKQASPIPRIPSQREARDVLSSGHGVMNHAVRDVDADALRRQKLQQLLAPSAGDGDRMKAKYGPLQHIS